jgi:hypothetical protein
MFRSRTLNATWGQDLALRWHLLDLLCLKTLSRVRVDCFAPSHSTRRGAWALLSGGTLDLLCLRNRDVSHRQVSLLRSRTFRSFRLQPLLTSRLSLFGALTLGLLLGLRLFPAGSPTSESRIEFTCVADGSFASGCSPPRLMTDAVTFGYEKPNLLSTGTCTPLIRRPSQAH